MQRLTFNLLSIVIAVFAVMQLVPSTPDNPPVETEMPAPVEVRKVLRQSCYDCHSFETAWPWYSRVAPYSWFIIREVETGRATLNFTAWNRMTPEVQNRAPEAVWQSIISGEMPPSYYLLLNPDAKLTGRDLTVMRAWLKQNPP